MMNRMFGLRCATLLLLLLEPALLPTLLLMLEALLVLLLLLLAPAGATLSSLESSPHADSIDSEAMATLMSAFR
ncbi:hypothetical protein ACDA63_10990 [Uliginosibacterium sp. sgz301328]|uniref:hypothetical protein n=1 Tax=Uliginosibacterium sp. sgz301328 TaxID=3243764 RepID=UPI00359E6487